METETKAVKKVSVKVKVKKKTAKKTVVKKPRVPQAKKEYTVPVLDPQQYFWLADGGGLVSLEALAEALEQMNEAQFAYHTERDGNDFARWIEGVFGDKTLAKLIAKQKTAEESAEILRKYLAK